MSKLNKKLLFYLFPLVIGAGIALYFFFRVNTIPEEKFRDLYIDLLVAQDSIGNDLKSTNTILRRLFREYEIDSVQYSKTVSLYSEDIEKWDRFFDDVILEMEARNRVADSVSRKGIDN